MLSANLAFGIDAIAPSNEPATPGEVVMYTNVELDEYLDEIREQVCSKCVERLSGGPPCAPLGKQCGVEQFLPEYLEAIHSVDSPTIEPYLEALRGRVCEGCDRHGCSECPCPLDYLFVLMVQAVETVDRRRLARRLLP